jgi:hypothetical protein
MAAWRSGIALAQETRATSSIAAADPPFAWLYVTLPLPAQGESVSTCFSSTSVHVLYGFFAQLSAPFTHATAPASTTADAIR